MNDKKTVVDSELMPQITSKVTDRVCQMQIDPAKSAGSFKYKGATYHFCRTHGLEKFQTRARQLRNSCGHLIQQR